MVFDIFETIEDMILTGVKTISLSPVAFKSFFINVNPASKLEAKQVIPDTFMYKGVEIRRVCLE